MSIGILLLSLRTMVFACKRIEKRSQHHELIKIVLFVLYTLACCYFYGYVPFCWHWLSGVNDIFYCFAMLFLIYFQEFISLIPNLMEQSKFKASSQLSLDEFFAIVKSVLVSPICEEIIFRGILSCLVCGFVNNQHIVHLLIGLLFSFSHWDSCTPTPELLLKFGYTFIFSVVSSVVYHASSK